MMTSALEFIPWKARKALCSLSLMGQPSTKAWAFVVKKPGLMIAANRLGFYWCPLCDCDSVDIKSNSISMGLLMTYTASESGKDKALGKNSPGYSLVSNFSWLLFNAITNCQLVSIDEC